jgi:hypothetical protein
LSYESLLPFVDPGGVEPPWCRLRGGCSTVERRVRYRPGERPPGRAAPLRAAVWAGGVEPPSLSRRTGYSRRGSPVPSTHICSVTRSPRAPPPRRADPLRTSKAAGSPRAASATSQVTDHGAPQASAFPFSSCDDDQCNGARTDCDVNECHPRSIAFAMGDTI